MQYTLYLNKILGNKTKISLLRVFYKLPDKIWTSRELADYIKTYNTTVLDNLNDFVDFGLLTVGMHGHGKTIKVNKNNFIFTQIVSPLFEQENNTFNELLSEIKKLVNPKLVKLFALYGSIAEHKERPDSDLDILIITYNKEKAEEQIIKRQSEIVEKFGNELSIIIWSLDEFQKKKNSPFLQVARKNAIIIYGDWNENSERQ